MKSTKVFQNAMHQAWNSPRLVANLAFDELFRHSDEISLDHDDQVQYALDIGVLAGTMKSPEEFIAAFENQFLME